MDPFTRSDPQQIDPHLLEEHLGPDIYEAVHVAIKSCYGMSNYPCWIGSKSCEVPADCSSTRVAMTQNIGLIEYVDSWANAIFAWKRYRR